MRVRIVDKIIGDLKRIVEAARKLELYEKIAGRIGEGTYRVNNVTLQYTSGVYKYISGNTKINISYTTIKTVRDTIEEIKKTMRILEEKRGLSILFLRFVEEFRDAKQLLEWLIPTFYSLFEIQVDEHLDAALSKISAFYSLFEILVS